MKKIFFTLFTFLLLASAVSASDDLHNEEKGFVTGWKFSPLQIGLGIAPCRNLMDKTTNTFFSFGLWKIEQESSVLSLCTINHLGHNYGLQLSPLAVLSDNNYGISFAPLLNGVHENYGVQLGMFNLKGKYEMINILGLQIADTVQIGAINGFAPVQIGVLNAGYDNEKTLFQAGIVNTGNSYFQIGLLNHNPGAWIPWFPIINFSFETAEKQDENEHTVIYRLSNH